MRPEVVIPLVGMMLPILTIAMSVGALIVWLVVWYRRRVHEIDCRHKERMAAIEKGLELPPDTLPMPEQTPARSRYLLRGLIWFGVGLAITFGARDWWSSRIGIAGWVAVAVGAAYLIFYFVEERRARLSKQELPASAVDHPR